jgi:hypothetical protein
MSCFIAFVITAIYEDQKIFEFVERLYWIEAESSLKAFDEVTTIAKTYDEYCTSAFLEIREFIGISELMPVLASPENGNVIGQRMYPLAEEREIRNGVMSRDEFIKFTNYEASADS